MPSVDATLEALWQRVVEDWDDDLRHGKLVSYAQQNRLLGDAATLYKQACGDGAAYRLSGTQADDAKKRLAGIVMLATMDLESSKTAPGVSSGLKALRIVAAIILVSTVLLLAWALTRR